MVSSRSLPDDPLGYYLLFYTEASLLPFSSLGEERCRFPTSFVLFFLLIVLRVIIGLYGLFYGGL